MQAAKVAEDARRRVRIVLKSILHSTCLGTGRLFRALKLTCCILRDHSQAGGISFHFHTSAPYFLRLLPQGIFCPLRIRLRCAPAMRSPPGQKPRKLRELPLNSFKKYLLPVNGHHFAKAMRFYLRLKPCKRSGRVAI
jgi:hypothetical protein